MLRLQLIIEGKRGGCCREEGRHGASAEAASGQTRYPGSLRSFRGRRGGGRGAAWRWAPRQPPGRAAGPVVSSPALAELPFPAARGRGRGAAPSRSIVADGGAGGRRGRHDAALVSLWRGGRPGGV